jgi:phosphoglycolate phosphatase
MAGDEYDFWLLDLDGTVVDVEPGYVDEVFAEVGDRLGHAFTEREAQLLWYGYGDGRDRLLDDMTIDPDRFWRVFHDVEDPRARGEATYVYDDAAAVIPDLEVPVGLVTHCQEYLTEPILETLDIADWFDTVVCCTDETGWKPDPRPLEMTMAALGVGNNGHAGVMAGDDPQDVGAAWNAGLDAVHVQRRDPETTGRCVMGDRRVDSLEELRT